MCNCHQEMNAVLEKHNGRLAVAFGVTSGLGVVCRLLIGTEKIDKTKRKALPHVVAAFCPFCGEKAANGDPKAEGEVTHG